MERLRCGPPAGSPCTRRASPTARPAGARRPAAPAAGRRAHRPAADRLGQRLRARALRAGLLAGSGRTTARSSTAPPTGTATCSSTGATRRRCCRSATQPLLRWRMERAAALEEGWGRLAADRPGRAGVRRARAAAGRATRARSTAGELHVGERPGGPWWDWSATKVGARAPVLVRPHHDGDAARLRARLRPDRAGAARGGAGAPTPSREDAQRELVRLAARAHGVATEKDLRDYFRLRPRRGGGRRRGRSSRRARCCRCEVEGWRGPAYLSAEAQRAAAGAGERAAVAVRPAGVGAVAGARGCSASTTASRSTCRPRSGCTATTCCRSCTTRRLRARVDLKGDRQAGVLRVRAAWLEDGCDAAGRPRRWRPSCAGPPTGRAWARWSSSRAATSPPGAGGRRRGGRRRRAARSRCCGRPGRVRELSRPRVRSRRHDSFLPAGLYARRRGRSFVLVRWRGSASSRRPLPGEPGATRTGQPHGGLLTRRASHSPSAFPRRT